MSNPFDQFDQAPTPQATLSAHAAGNPFDQFDGGSTSPAQVPAAQRTNAQGQHPNMLQAGIMDLTNSAPWQDMVGAFNSANLNGFGGFVGRHLIADQGPVGQVTRGLAGIQGNPNQQQVNQAVQGARQDAAQQQQRNAQNIAIPNPFSKTGSTNFDPLATASGLVGGVDPTLAVPIPGLGGFAGRIAGDTLAPVAARVAARIGGNAAGHAAFGSAADAVYQGADMLDGLQQGFDVNRNLHAAATMGVLGGLGGTLHEVQASPFIQDLYKQRNGLDTTPSDNPTGTTNPMSGAQGMTPAQLQEYHAVLSTGNQSDIHNFFNDKNILPPTHTDINDWVNRRDAQPDRFNPVPDDRPSADQLTQNMIGTPDLRGLVNDHIAEQTKNWKNAPQYEVINHTDDIADPQVREAAARAGANDPSALGFVGGDNKVRIFANRIDSPETLNAVLYHESLGHYGLQQQFGDRLDSTIDNLMNRNVSQFGRDVDQWQKENPGAYGGNRTRAGEEVLANMSNNGTIKKSLFDALDSHVRTFGRKMGLQMSYSDGEVRNIMAMAHDAVLNGKGTDVRANGFSTARKTYNPTDLGANAASPAAGGADPKFMFTGPRATNFNPDHPLAYDAKDGVTRNEIGDEHSKFNSYNVRPNSKAMLDQVLDHPQLYREYPSLRDLPVHGRDMGTNGDLGFYDPNKHAITLNTQARGDMHSTLLHEVQHAIQGIEGSPGIKGGTAHLAKQDYLSNPLEREARTTQARQDWGFEDRLANSPKFMRKSDLAASKDYVAQDLERIYKSLDENYVPTTKSFAETRRDAIDAGFKPSQVKDLADFKDLDVKLHRLQAAANMTDMKLASLNEKLGSDKWTMDDQANYMTTLADQATLVARIKGNRSELARALNVSKMAASYSVNTMAAVAERMREEGSGLAELAQDPVKFMKFAQQIKNLMSGGNPAGARVLIAGVNKPYWEQYINSFHFNAMLSALSTHVKAPVDMGTGLLRDVIEKTLAVPIGAARVGVGKIMGHTLEKGVSPEEVAIHAYAMGKSVITGEVYKAMVEGVKTGQGGWVGPDGTNQHVNMMNQYGSVSNPDLGPVLALPSHLVSAQDTFFRSNAMMSNMYSFGMREAIKALGPGASSIDRMTMASSLAMNPSDKMLEYATQKTNRSLLLNNNSLNNFITKYRTYTPNMSVGQRVGALVLNTLAPFIRVESNSLINRFVQRSPLAVLDPYTLKTIRAGGPEADIAMAKIAYGTATLALAWAAAGKLTGGLSSNPAKRQELEAGGERVNSVKEDGHYDQSSNLAMSVFPWDQHNATAQMVKSARDAFESPGATPQQKMVGYRLAMESIMHHMADMSWVASAAPGIDALSSDETQGPGKIARFVGDTAKTFVPSILNQTERMTDSRRDTRPDDPTDPVAQSVNDMKASIPGLAQTLPTKYTVYGQPFATGATPEGIHNWLGRGNNTTEPTDPAIKELNRLADLTKAAIVTPTQRTVKFDGMTVHLNASQAEDYQKYAGQTIVEAVRSQQQSGAWSSMSEQDRVQFVRSTQTQAKKEVREALLQQPNWLNEDQLSTLRSQASGAK